MEEFIKNLLQSKITNSIIIIAVSYIVYKLIKSIIDRGEKNDKLNKHLDKRKKTFIRLTNSVLRSIFVIITVLILLQINGVDVSAMLAGVGIASVIIGLAIQDALKDIIRGFNILSDDYFKVGDVVQYGDITGKVLVLGLRTTKIKDIATDNIISIANRNIEQIQVVSNSLYINFPMPYELSVNEAEDIVKEIIDEVKKVNDVEDVTYKGVKELADSSIKYLIKVICLPERRLQVNRDSLGVILRTLDKNNIQVPYNQIDIHQK